MKVEVSMYRVLNPHCAGTLLGLMEVALIPIPFPLQIWPSYSNEVNVDK